MLFLREHAFLRIYFLQILYATSTIFAWGFTFLYFIGMGFSYEQILFFNIVTYVGVMAGVLVMGRRTIRAYAYIKAAIILVAATYLLVYLLSNTTQFYLLAIVSGLVMPLFWIPFNVLYFRMRKRDTIASMSGVSFMVFPVLGAILPLFSGAFTMFFGLRNLFAVAAVVSLLPLAYAVKTQTKTKIKFDLRKAVYASRRVQGITLVEGVWQGVDWVAVPLFTLYFIKEGFRYGAFLSYIGLAGAIAALLLCKLSDRMRRDRAKFVLPVVTLTGLFTVLSGATHTLGYWLIMRGIVGFLAAVTAPFTMSVLIDKSRSIKDTIIARELFLNLGRILGVLIVAVVYVQTKAIQTSLVISGLIFMLYPVFVIKNRLYPARISLKSIILDDILGFRRG